MTGTSELKVEFLTYSLNAVDGFHLSGDFYTQPTDFGGCFSANKRQ